ncbi:hypothetical protein [Embleya sp. NBC_00896]|uniref:hypothetical protein n=1 Tax=Embleya sp. NBC_00896 TaxID=2975961 RepID=UPI00386C941C|nr:hypothetical protein OG928_09130 [Embleya sp. NBC_00896]
MGSALAAISSAFLLSTLGVAGTVIGAALASVVATVGSAVYVHLVKRTGEQLRDVRATLIPAQEGGPSPDPTEVPGRPTGPADRRPATDETVLLPVGEYERFDVAGVVGTGATRVGDTGSSAQSGGRRVRLGRSLVGAVLVFVVAMGVVTLTETALGRSFASLFGHGDKGGSTISHIVDDKPARHDTPKPPTGSTPSPSGSAEPGHRESPGTGDQGTSGGNTGGEGSTPTPSTTPSTRPSGTPSPDPTGSTPPSTTPPSPPAGGSSGENAGGANPGGGAGAGGAGSAQGSGAGAARVPAP